jgi:hypothetical protein
LTAALSTAAAFGAVLVLTMLLADAAKAQTSIDKGKQPAEIFSMDCAVCHKTTKGLANGRNNLALATFLHDHYTSSREEASALATYVLGAGGGSGPPPPPPTTTASKPSEAEPKVAARPKPDDQSGAEPPPTPVPGPAARHENRNASRNRKPEPEAAPPPEPEAPAAQAPAQDTGAGTSVAMPADTQPSDAAPVPRDNIPD